MYRRVLFLLFTVVLLISSSPAHAYIDAATGSMILQVVLGGVAGGLVLAKLYWHRIKGYLGFKTKEATEPESADS